MLHLRPAALHLTAHRPVFLSSSLMSPAVSRSNRRYIFNRDCNYSTVNFLQDSPVWKMWTTEQQIKQWSATCAGGGNAGPKRQSGAREPRCIQCKHRAGRTGGLFYSGYTLNKSLCGGITHVGHVHKRFKFAYRLPFRCTRCGRTVKFLQMKQSNLSVHIALRLVCSHSSYRHTVDSTDTARPPHSTDVFTQTFPTDNVIEPDSAQ